MEYLLIYENENRFKKGYDPAEMGEYERFGKEFAMAIKGGNALQPTTAARTVQLAICRNQRAVGRILPRRDARNR